MATIRIINLSNPGIEITAQLAESFISKFLGLMFRRDLPRNHGILIDEHAESRLNTSIHMFFMFFDITALWINQDLIVVDKRLAIKGHPAYMPIAPARYVLEIDTENYLDYKIGDQLHFTYEK
jgi:uncharacterized membrane protein (UPF0127 family)